MPLSSWSTTAADNDDADSASGITWPEGMDPAQVNNSARAMMAVLAGDALGKDKVNYITTTGSLGVGQTALQSDGSIGEPRFQATGATGARAAALFIMSGVSDPYIGFYKSGTGMVGTITGNGGVGVAYNTTSDYRLKTDLVPLTGAIERVKMLPAWRGRWKNVPDAPLQDFFLAHEAQAVIPEAVRGVKDAVTKKGEPLHQTMDYSKTVVLLTAAIQELAARVEQLEA